MVDEKEVELSSEIISYIERELKKGVSEEEIKKKLLGVGHQEHIIIHHLKHVNRKKNSKKLFIYSVLSVVVVLVIIFFMYRPSNNQSPVINTNPVLNSAPVVSANNFFKDPIVFCENYTLLDKTGCELEVNNDNQLSDIRFDKLAMFDAMRTSNSSACDSLNGYSKDVCVDASKILLMSDLASCNGLKTPYMKEYCKTTIYFKMAQETNDVSLCENIVVPRGYSRTCKEVAT